MKITNGKTELTTKEWLRRAYLIDELNKLYSKTLKNGKVKKFMEY